MAIRKDIKIDAGASFKIAFRLKDSIGNTLEIDGWTAESHIKASHNDTIPLAIFNSSIDYDTDTVTLSLSPEESAKLQSIKDDKKGVWDVFLEGPDNVRTKVLKGSVTVDKAVTLDV